MFEYIFDNVEYFNLMSCVCLTTSSHIYFNNCFRNYKPNFHQAIFFCKWFHWLNNAHNLQWFLFQGNLWWSMLCIGKFKISFISYWFTEILKKGNYLHFLPFCSIFKTHWGQVMHICNSKQTIIGLDNGIIWTNARMLLIGTLGTNFSEILSEFYTFWFMKMHLKMLTAKSLALCLGLNVLTEWCIVLPRNTATTAILPSLMLTLIPFTCWVVMCKQKNIFVFAIIQWPSDGARSWNCSPVNAAEPVWW